MTDLRQRIAGVLLDRLADFHTGDYFMAHQLAEAVLSLPGVAIVDVTDPDAITDLVLAVGRHNRATTDPPEPVNYANPGGSK